MGKEKEATANGCVSQNVELPQLVMGAFDPHCLLQLGSVPTYFWCDRKLCRLINYLHCIALSVHIASGCINYYVNFSSTPRVYQLEVMNTKCNDNTSCDISSKCTQDTVSTVPRRIVFPQICRLFYERN